MRTSTPNPPSQAPRCTGMRGHATPGLTPVGRRTA